MRLYRYFATHAYETLRDKRLKVSRITELNDPFEFLYYTTPISTNKQAKFLLRQLENCPESFQRAQQKNSELTPRKFKKSLRTSKVRQRSKEVLNRCDVNNPSEFRKSLDKSIRTCSFTAANLAPSYETLMWAHYARGHEGTRIGFDLTGEGVNYFTKAINYSEQRIAVDISVNPYSEQMKDTLLLAAYTKSPCWSYEREVRLFVQLNQCVQENIDGQNMTFFPFNGLTISSVDFGLKCPSVEKNKIIELLKKDYPSVSIREAVFHKTEFLLNYQEVGT